MLLCGCFTPGALIDPELWEEASAAVDPFADRPAAVGCDADGWGPDEETIFEIDTDLCAYGTFTQPTLRRVGPGATVELLVWHLDLYAGDPAEAHVVVQIGDVVLLEERPAIPGPEEAWDLSIPWPEDADPAAAGTPAWFHVHNHGENAWRIGAIEIVR
jgi:hypothetical protein